jgi:hypothetical protein
MHPAALQANCALPDSAEQQVLQRRLLDVLDPHAPGDEARDHRAVRAPQSGRVGIAGQIEAVASGQPGWYVYCPHALFNVARRLLDHTLVV